MRAPTHGVAAATVHVAKAAHYTYLVGKRLCKRLAKHLLRCNVALELFYGGLQPFNHHLIPVLLTLGVV